MQKKEPITFSNCYGLKYNIKAVCWDGMHVVLWFIGRTKGSSLRSSLV